MDDIAPKLIEIGKKAYINEKDALKALAPLLEIYKEKDQIIRQKASRYIKDIKSKNYGITQKLLAAYPIKSESGRAIMSLAESLTRIPDKETAYELINDKIKGTSWKPVNGRGISTIAVEAGLKLASITGANLAVHKSLNAAFRMLGDEFVLAEDIESAIREAKKYKKEGYMLSYDMLGEGARTSEQATGYFESYMDAIKKAEEGDSVSIKISALHPRYELIKLEQLKQELFPKLRMLVSAAMNKGTKITIDAEEARRLDLTLLIFSELYSEFNYNGFGLAVQAYNKRSLEVLKFLSKLGSMRIPVRLVKGAYWDSEIKKAQELGLEGFPVYTAKSNSDLSYLACAKFMLDNNDKFYPQFATHNLLTILAIDEIAAGKDFEFQKLYGMGDEVYDMLNGKLKAKCRIYAPVGAHSELLSYLIRRLLENGANSSFVNQLASGDEASIVRSPFAEARYAKVELPIDIFPSRRNSKGYDLGVLYELEDLKGELAKEKLELGKFDEASGAECDEAIKLAKKAFKEWSAISVHDRAEMMEKAAKLLYKNEHLLIKALMLEGKKNISDAINEVREAADFCRYYALTARTQLPARKMPGITGEENTYELHGRGVFVCISPWNFPLAIFMGQVVAALVTGNTVIAKPAEQTPTIAEIAVKILHKAGVPEDALQLITGKGEVVGKALTESPEISGVCFTGGTDTAKHIQKAIASNPAIIPFIAETGGQNAMIVDSSALLEQAVDDIVTSAFGSTGQRCSALRVLYVQDEIADELIRMVKGAAKELEHGDAFSADIRGLIDAEAEENIRKHIEKFGKKDIPAIIELKSISELSREIFGPVLHIIRFKKLSEVIAEINSTGYGLTFGVHTRIMNRAEYLAKNIRAGNIYINRSMIGAVVESQPFGGMGLSGTGFKAGGPNYLLRFCDEKVISNNKTAIGGNFDIL